MNAAANRNASTKRLLKRSTDKFTTLNDNLPLDYALTSLLILYSSGDSLFDAVLLNNIKMTLAVGNAVSMLDSAVAEVPLPRVSLRKRKATQSKNEGAPSSCLPSVDSAFLGGLFADVAEIQRTDEDSSSTSTKDLPSVTAQMSVPQEESPTKKSRSSLTRAISRCPKSFKNLGEAFFPSCSNLSPVSVADGLTSQITPESSPTSSARSTVGSCARVPEISSSSTGMQGSLSFPHLPPAVSVSSCNSTVTRANSADLQSSNTETEDKECYGWFVEMDNNDSAQSAHMAAMNPYEQSSSANSGLAFVAHTAPEADNHDAEVEWAKAADTVDDVLGDFF